MIDPALRVARKAISGKARHTCGAVFPVNDRYLVNERPVAVVTGAANGIGLAVTRQLAAKGHRVLAVDHDGPALARLTAKTSSDACSCIEADLADPTACETVVDKMRSRGSMSLLVHCAGTSSVGHFGDIDIDAHYRTLNVNLLVS